MTISIIAALARNRVIGKNNRLPWKLPADMKHFQELTRGKPIIMGRRTFESIGKALAGRENIILARDKDFQAPGCEVVHSIEEAISTAEKSNLGKKTGEVMICGGASVYKQFLPLAHKMYLTLIDADIEGDSYFPRFKKDNWKIIKREPHPSDKVNAYPYTFLTLMKKNYRKGKFIVFEGLDGSGQSTQVNLLAEFLKAKGANVLATKEPTKESEPSKKIQKALDEKQKLSPKELQQLFRDDRKWHLKNVIKPGLKQGKVVISDRYFFSSFAYGMSDGLDFEWLKEINKDFLMPDIVFYLNVSPETCIQRIENRGGAKKLFEKLEKLKKVSEAYKKVFNDFEDKTCIHIINGEPSIKEVFNQISTKLKLS